MSTALYYPGPIGGKEFGTAIELLVANKWVAWANRLCALPGLPALRVADTVS
jgi:hypothetical protein